MELNSIYCGDCLTVLKKFPKNKIDLIYLDPPFFSNKHYEVIWNDGAEIRAFGDRWRGGIHHYVKWMMERLEQSYRVLKKDGILVIGTPDYASFMWIIIEFLYKLFHPDGYADEHVTRYNYRMLKKILLKNHACQPP